MKKIINVKFLRLLTIWRIIYTYVRQIDPVQNILQFGSVRVSYQLSDNFHLIQFSFEIMYSEYLFILIWLEKDNDLEFLNSDCQPRERVPFCFILKMFSTKYCRDFLFCGRSNISKEWLYYTWGNVNQSRLRTPDLHIWSEQTFGHAITQSKEWKPKLKFFFLPKRKWNWVWVFGDAARNFKMI